MREALQPQTENERIFLTRPLSPLLLYHKVSNRTPQTHPNEGKIQRAGFEHIVHLIHMASGRTRPVPLIAGNTYLRHTPERGVASSHSY